MVEEKVKESALRGFAKGGMSVNHDPYAFVGNLTYMGNVAIADRFHGEMTRQDQREIVEICRNRGCKFLLADRGAGGLPSGKVVPEGLPFAGWIYVDLTKEKVV